MLFPNYIAILVNSLNVWEAVEITVVAKEIAKFNSEILAPNRVSISYKTSEISINDILSAINKSKLEVTDLSVEEADLEEVFRYLTRK